MQPVYSGAIRSLYPPETFELDSYHYLYANHNYCETIEGDERAGSIQENQLNSEPSGACEVPSMYPEVDCSVKIDCFQETKGKHMESPSNS